MNTWLKLTTISATALFIAGQWKDAAADYRKALELRSDYCEACANLAMTYAKMNDSKQAIDTARQALGLARAGKGRVGRTARNVVEV